MTGEVEANTSISEKNAAFWDELCGTQLAKSLGVTDNSPASLKRFDDWYFDFYPYLLDHIPFAEMKGKDVLEIGLGYGTVSQRIAESGAQFRGLDIAAGPVAMVNQRIQQSGLAGQAVQGSILAAPFADQSFDFVVAIGSMHHTGDLQKAISECHRVLRPGGKLIFMVYYAYSYRRFRQAPRETLAYAFRELTGHRGVVGSSDETERVAYDRNDAGDGAPHTDWISARSLQHFCREFQFISKRVENLDAGMPIPFYKRENYIGTKFSALVGLDIYVTATK